MSLDRRFRIRQDAPRHPRWSIPPERDGSFPAAQAGAGSALVTGQAAVAFTLTYALGTRNRLGFVPTSRSPHDSRTPAMSAAQVEGKRESPGAASEMTEDGVDEHDDAEHLE